ncbi:MAG: potassium/proton antiporter [Microbacter sp.]
MDCSLVYCGRPLLGAIISSTDAAAVFSILRSRSLGLKGNLKPLLELESGSNDPMAYLLTILFTVMSSNKDASVMTFVILFFKQLVLGGVIGYGAGLFMQRIFNWIKLEFEGLYAVLMITLVLLTFSLTDFLGGNAFLAVYLAAYTLGNSDFIHKKSLTKHFDGQAWLMQIILFVTLGLLVVPKQLLPFTGIVMVISLFLILIARPLSGFLSLLLFRMQLREKIFISWVGLRGAVPIVLATFPLVAGISKSQEIFNLVFFISLTSVLIQGTTLPIIAKWLNLNVPVTLKKKSVIDLEQAWGTKSIYKSIRVEANFHCIGKSIVDLKLPNTIIIALIERKNKFFLSDGATRIMDDDVLYVMADNEKALESLYACLT